MDQPARTAVFHGGMVAETASGADEPFAFAAAFDEFAV